MMALLVHQTVLQVLMGVIAGKQMMEPSGPVAQHLVNIVKLVPASARMLYNHQRQPRRQPRRRRQRQRRRLCRAQQVVVSVQPFVQTMVTLTCNIFGVQATHLGPVVPQVANAEARQIL